jgi:hypothetical protein
VGTIAALGTDDLSRITDIKIVCGSHDAPRPFGQGGLLPSVRCARYRSREKIASVEVIGFLALFLITFVFVGSDPEGRD